MKIMIVDDNYRMRQMIKSAIQRNIKQVTEIVECESGEDAVERYDTFSPDWVLMDIKLNDMNGLTAAEIIIKKDIQVKIIILTQYNEAVYKNKAKRIGARAYVLKDNLQELVGIIKNELP